MEDAVNKKKPRTKAKKYNEGFDVGKELAEILAIYEERAYADLLEGSKNFVKLLRNGLPDTVLEFLRNPDHYDLVPKNLNKGSHQSDGHPVRDPVIPDSQEPVILTHLQADDQDHCGQEAGWVQENAHGLVEGVQVHGKGTQDGVHTQGMDDGLQMQGGIMLKKGFKDLPDKHRSSFTKNCCIKTIKGTGGCGYAAVTYKLFLDEDQFPVFRQSCHEFLVRVWRLMGWSSFVVYPFPITEERTGM
jgi:hypothetical protein